MRKLLSWVAFAATIITFITLAAFIFFKVSDFAGLPIETMERHMELFIGTSFVVTITVASKVRHWVAGTKTKVQKVSHVR